MKVYIAGPMTGLPQFNIPAFEAAAAALRAAGYEVVSPVELDSTEIRTEALASTDGHMELGGKIGGETWGEILARDVAVVADEVDAVVVLPGWAKSRGARLEVFTALLCKKPVYAYPDISFEGCPVLWDLHTDAVLDSIMRSFQGVRS